MNTNVPQSEEDAPTTVIAVPSLTPEYGLLYLQPEGGYDAGTIRPIYGGNLDEDSVFTNGTMPNEWRSTFDSEEQGREVIFRPLPPLIEELVPEDYCRNGEPVMVRVITNCKVIQMPKQPEEFLKPKPVLRVHPAVYFNPERNKAKPKPPKDPAQQRFPFAIDPNVQPNQLTA